MFRSQTIIAHLIRGVIGLGALTFAMMWMHSDPPLAIAALIVALLSLRGCPMCWTVGLIETIAYSRRKSIDGACPGCGAPPSERPTR